MEKNKRSNCPKTYTVTHRSGQVSFQVDIGLAEGKRKRVNFAVNAEAQGFAEQSSVTAAPFGKTTDSSSQRPSSWWNASRH
jgi:hypothetical protein